jgi:hypothetical protein
MRLANRRARCRQGWTLVELIMVMMAMLILSSVVWKAGTAAIGWANNARMATEVARLSKAMDDFCAQFGEYPPDFHDQMAVWRFLKKKFPNCPHQKYPIMADYSPASALYFWLAGPKGRGFSTNPANPFDDSIERIGPFFKFDKERLKVVDDVMQYLPPRGSGDPYVYFRGGSKGYDGHPGWSSARPYRDSVRFEWIEPNRFQILCPGNDGKLGSGCHFPGGTDYDAANFDDITSFSRGETLGSSIPKLIPDDDKDKDKDEVTGLLR